MSETSRRYGPFFLAALLVLAFHDVAQRYDGFRIHNGPPFGMELPPSEIVFFAYFGLFGSLFVYLFARGVRAIDEGACLTAWVSRQGGSRWFLPALCLFLFVEVLALKDFVLHGTFVTDDEGVYVFIAKTLLNFDVKNAPPAGLDDHYRSTFVLLREGGWYGKYPIGHPMLLAVGEALGARIVVVPLAAVASLCLTHRIARRIGAQDMATGASLLLVASPQFVATAATELSQASSQLSILTAVHLSMIAVDGSSKRAEAWALIGTGVALGFGVLARPLPGVLFTTVVTVFIASRYFDRGNVVLWLRRLLPLVLPILVLGCGFLLVQWRQSGDPFRSGYHDLHGEVLMLPGTREGILSSSVAGGLIRQFFWAFGAPLVLLAVCLAHPRGDARAWLLWGLVGAGYSYRLIAPKVFVGTTGPVYLAELVPLLAILVCVGVKWLCERSPVAREWVAPAVLGAVIASVTMFCPVQMDALARNAQVQRFVPDRLAELNVERALVFANRLAPAGSGHSWVMTPPPPSPNMDDRILYVRAIGTPEDLSRFWLSKHEDRRAFFLDVGPSSVELVELPRP